MKNLKEHPKHLPRIDGWMMVQADLNSDERLNLKQIKEFLIGDEQAEIGEFIQRGNSLRVIYKSQVELKKNQ